MRPLGVFTRKFILAALWKPHDRPVNTLPHVSGIGANFNGGVKRNVLGSLVAVLMESEEVGIPVPHIDQGQLQVKPESYQRVDSHIGDRCRKDRAISVSESRAGREPHLSVTPSLRRPFLAPPPLASPLQVYHGIRLLPIPNLSWFLTVQEAAFVYDYGDCCHPKKEPLDSGIHKSLEDSTLAVPYRRV